MQRDSIIFPTPQSIFDLMDFDFEEDNKMCIELIDNEIQDNLNSLVEQYDELFTFDNVNWNENNVPELYGINHYFLDTNPLPKDVNVYNNVVAAEPHVNIKGTIYENILDSDHIVCDELECTELSFAETPCIYNWPFVQDVANDSYERIVRCYLSMIKDGVVEAYHCLGSAFDNTYDTSSYGLTYYYYIEGARKNNIECFTALADKVMQYSSVLAFKLNYIAAKLGSPIGLWNISIYYLYGYYLPQSKDKAKEIYYKLKSMELPNIEDVNLDYYVSQNLQALELEDSKWSQYFNKEILRKWRIANDILNITSPVDWNITSDKVNENMRHYLTMTEDELIHKKQEANLTCKIENLISDILYGINCIDQKDQLLCCVKDGNSNLVHKSLDRRILNRPSVSLYLLKAWLYKQVQQRYMAIPYYQKAYDLIPSSHTLTDIFECYYEDGNYEEALPVAQRLVDEYGNSFRIMLVKTQIKMLHPSESIALIEKSLDELDSFQNKFVEATLSFAGANICYNEGLYDKALTFVERAAASYMPYKETQELKQKIMCKINKA